MGCGLARLFIRRFQGRVISGAIMMRRLSTDRPSAQILEVLKNVLHGEGITQYTHFVSQGPAHGENNMGKLYRMRVMGTKDGNGTELSLICKTRKLSKSMVAFFDPLFRRIKAPLSLLISEIIDFYPGTCEFVYTPLQIWSKSFADLKVPPLSPARRQKFETHKHYQRETFVYNKILPAFDKIQNMLNIEDRFRHPKCYHASAVEDQEIIFLEDLSCKGFEMSGTRNKYLAVPELESVIKELAKFHALSFAVKEHMADSYSMISGSHDLLITGSMKDPLESSAKKAMNLIEDQTIKKKFRKFSDNIYSKAGQILGANQVEPYAVLTHGDFWGNNILMKYNVSTTPEVCFIDYQGSRYNSPLVDLMHLFVTAANSATRLKYGTHLFDYYYANLAAFLVELRCDPDKFYPRDVFLQHLSAHAGDFGVFIAMFFMPVISMPKEMLHDLDEYVRLVEDNPKDDVYIFKTEAGKKLFAEKFNSVLNDLVQLKLF